MSLSGAPGLGLGAELICLVALVLTRLAAQGVLPLNPIAGIRTRATMSSPRAWRVGHRAAMPWAFAATVVGCGLAAPGVVLSQPDRSSRGVGDALCIGGFVVSVVLITVGGRAADRAARDA